MTQLKSISNSVECKAVLQVTFRHFWAQKPKVKDEPFPPGAGRKLAGFSLGLGIAGSVDIAMFAGPIITLPY